MPFGWLRPLGRSHPKDIPDEVWCIVFAYLNIMHPQTLMVTVPSTCRMWRSAVAGHRAHLDFRWCHELKIAVSVTMHTRTRTRIRTHAQAISLSLSLSLSVYRTPSRSLALSLSRSHALSSVSLASCKRVARGASLQRALETVGTPPPAHFMLTCTQQRRHR